MARLFGKLAKEHMYSVIDEVLNDIHDQGWSIEWVAIRRRFNKEADSVATFAVKEARKLLENYITAPTKISVQTDEILDQ